MNAMNNFLLIQFMLQGICFLAIQPGITANNNCNTLKLGPKDPLLITIFDSEYKMGKDILDILCEAIKQFPQGLVTMEYRAGALATGDAKNIKCGSGDCKVDQLQGCWSLSKYYSDCYHKTESYISDVIRCYCTQKINQSLLDNAALRVSWKIPENSVPTLAMNKTYDPCVKFGSAQEILTYLCQVYQKQVGKCK